jgi:hypothetical protein
LPFLLVPSSPISLVIILLDLHLIGNVNFFAKLLELIFISRN